MLPHSNFGVRVRGCRIVSKVGGGVRGRINVNFLQILGAISKAGQALVKVPFYRQGRRG
jgi:hypothetical protein